MIETARLLLRPFEPRDRAAFAELVTDPRVTAGSGPILPGEDCDALFDFYLACWREEGLAYGAIEHLGNASFLGMAGLAICPMDPPLPPVCEIGWALLPACQGRGYALEAADGWLGHAFGPLGLDRVTALTWKGNPRSLRVIERLGFRYDADFVHPDGQKPEGRLAFVLTADDWHGSCAERAAE